jgi:hypothetical protein
MYKLIAEQIDATTGRSVFTHTVIADSFEPFVGNAQGRGSMTYATSNGSNVFLLGGDDKDFQLVSVFEGDGRVIGSASYDAATATVMWVSGPVAR